jgi:hypothetical protein
VLHLITSKCLPSLLYASEACKYDKAALQSLDFTVTRFLMKIFNTNDRGVISECRNFSISCCHTVKLFPEEPHVFKIGVRRFSIRFIAFIDSCAVGLDSLRISFIVMIVFLSFFPFYSYSQKCAIKLHVNTEFRYLELVIFRRPLNDRSRKTMCILLLLKFE